MTTLAVEETVTCYDVYTKPVDALQRKCSVTAEEKAVSIKLSILWLRKKGIKLPVHIIVPFSPDRCGWKGCFMFSVQFLITKKWRGPFYHGSDDNVYTQVPNRGNEFHAHVLSPQQ